MENVEARRRAARSLKTGVGVLDELLDGAPLQTKAAALSLARLAVIDERLGQVVMHRLEADCRPLLRDPEPEDGDDPDLVFGRAWLAFGDGLLAASGTY